ncbi:hypothetical protein HYT24_03335 [Candidatus Pacearchaeota archaeon]|nr:hypothetical protein [Candidatus Pacearchaeota archaeon]
MEKLDKIRRMCPEIFSEPNKINPLTFEEAHKIIFSTNPPLILHKREFYPLYEKGFLGNKAKTWNSYKEIIESNWKGKVTMRSKKGGDRKQAKYGVRLEEIEKNINDWKKMGISEDMIVFNESMPDEDLIFQGEAILKNGRLYIYYSTLKKQMNIALAEKSDVLEGFWAEKAMKENCTNESFEEFKKLITLFPKSVIEFSVYSKPIGNQSHLNKNTIFWEVRNY